MITVMGSDSLPASDERWDPQIQIQPNWIFMMNALKRYHPRCTTASTIYIQLTVQSLQVGSCFLRHRVKSPDHPILGCCRTDFLSSQIDSTSVGNWNTASKSKCLIIFRCIWCLMRHFLSYNLQKLIFIAVIVKMKGLCRPCPLIRMEVRVKSLNTCWNILGLNKYNCTSKEYW